MSSMTAAPSPIFAIASDYVDAVAALDPFEATGMGVPGHDAEVTDYSPDALEARAELARRTLATLGGTQPAGRDDEVARAVMTDALRRELAEHEAGDAYYSLRPIAGPVPGLSEIFDLMPQATEADWHNIVARLNALPRAAASIEALFAEGMRQGRLSSQRQVEEVLKQVAGYSGQRGDATPAFTGLPDALATAGLGNTGLAADLERAIGHGREAFAGLGRFLTERYLPAAPEAEAAGPERYGRAAQRFLGMTLDLQETYNWGWEEIRRLDAEMTATAARIKPGVSVQEAAALLDGDPARTIEGEAALAAWLQELEDAAVRAVDGRLADLPEPVRRIEARIAPPGGALAQYYTGPSEDFSRPGRTWYPTGGHTQFHRWRDVTTAYHEGVPGHHLQVALAVYQAQHLSRFQRLAVWYPGHGEGWALYAERLMAEEGFLADPADYLGMLLGQMHRAVRVVVDIGAHTGLRIPADAGFEPGEPWTYARMKAFLMRKADVPEDFAHSETVRYLGWPGQAISYKVGERAWLRLREESRARLGDRFTLREFHNTALSLGSMGLDLLGETLLRGSEQ